MKTRVALAGFLLTAFALSAGTVKDVCGISGETFRASRETALSRREDWLEKAKASTPKLFRREVKPVHLVKVVSDKAALGRRSAAGGVGELQDIPQL